MAQEEVTQKSVALIVKGGKLTGRILAWAMKAFLERARQPTAKRGKQSLRSLAKQGAGLADIEVSGDNIGSFKGIARKYGVDFALKQDASANPPRFIVFFKAKDSKALESAFNEYSKVQLKRGAKTSLLQRLAKYKEKAKAAAPPAKNRNMGER